MVVVVETEAFVVALVEPAVVMPVPAVAAKMSATLVLVTVVAVDQLIAQLKVAGSVEQEVVALVAV